MPAVLSVLAETSPLAHLKICPECEASRVSAPALCKGRQYPDHQDWWYETCLENHRPTHSQCKYFSWREDIPKGKPATSAQCRGTLCQQLRAARRVNFDCTFGVCARCCAEVRSIHLELRSCAVSAHAKAVIHGGAVTVNLPGDEGVESPTPGGAPLVSGPDPSPSKGASTVVPRPPAAKKQRSYAISISPMYQERLAVLEQTDRRRVEEAEIEAGYEQRQNRLVTLYWWSTNGQPASVFVIEATRFPYFHPRDSPQLVSRFKTDSDSFQYFEWKLMSWVHGDASSPVRNVKTAGELHYRSDGVDQAPGMPPRGVKRGLEDPEEYGRLSYSSPMPFGGASPWTRSSSILATPSSSLRSTPTTSVATMTPSSIVTATPQSAASSFSGSSAITPTGLGAGAVADVPELERLPALFPEMMNLTSSSPIAVHSPSPSASIPSESGSTSTHDEPDFGPAPRGRFGWPLMYVCDMAAGFAAMRRLQDLGADRAVAFEEAFKQKFVRSTWSDNSRVWTASAQQPNVRETWIRAGRSELGLWTAFVKHVKKG
ncbi:hypothetical protein LXA43DRAFT_1103667 [Ganoderma leucocontextum]|nr:hypothetical protein LXA43DRAFT_1103667 [Ganoderma leucocontextum]